MSKCELISFKDAEALAQAAAAQWLQQLRSRPSGLPYLVALSGGRIARQFLQAVARAAKAEDFRSVHFFWGDERCVPPEDPESNFRLAREALLEPMGISAGQIHRIRGEVPPEVGAAQAESELRQLAPANPGGQPVLDLVFLGMGEDGHVASLFPGEAEPAMASASVFRPVVGPKPPPHRITLGYPALVAARQVWVLAAGSEQEKQRALAQSLAGEGRTPLARVLQRRSQTRILEAVSGGRAPQKAEL